MSYQGEGSVTRARGRVTAFDNGANLIFMH